MRLFIKNKIKNAGDPQNKATSKMKTNSRKIKNKDNLKYEDNPKIKTTLKIEKASNMKRKKAWSTFETLILYTFRALGENYNIKM